MLVGSVSVISIFYFGVWLKFCCGDLRPVQNKYLALAFSSSEELDIVFTRDKTLLLTEE